MRTRPGFWRLAAAAAAMACALALPELPAAASTAAPHSLSSASHPAGAAVAACATSRPHSGKILYSGIRGGMGRLGIKNSLSHDAVIVLVRGKSKAIGVYVRSEGGELGRHRRGIGVLEVEGLEGQPARR